VTIFDRRSGGTDENHLYYISFYLESHRLHPKHVFIYATKAGTEKKIERERIKIRGRKR
jgi:hypothetical protein